MMKLTRCLLLGSVAIALSLAAPMDAAAQDDAPPPQRPTETELVFDREVFQYPAFTRRNPFRPLDAPGGSDGPRFEQLTLVGIIYIADDPSQSIAHLTTGGIAVAEDGTVTGTEGDSYYLRSGETAGNVTVTEIRRDEVDVTVSEFDQLIPRTMVFVSRRPGGTP